MVEKPPSGLPPLALERWQHRHEYNQTEAARALGVTRNQYRRYLSGVTTIPKTVALLCQCLDRQAGFTRRPSTGE